VEIESSTQAVVDTVKKMLSKNPLLDSNNRNQLLNREGVSE
jgi:hypothetical protein